MQAPLPQLVAQAGCGDGFPERKNDIKGNLAQNTLSNYYYRVHDETDDAGGITGRLLRPHFAISRKIGPRVTIDQIGKGAEREKQTAKPP